METARINRLLRQKEGIRLEFKEAAAELPGNLFETICAMLNREGGDILLGVRDDGTVTGIAEQCIETMITNLINLSNNPNKLDPLIKTASTNLPLKPCDYLPGNPTKKSFAEAYGPPETKAFITQSTYFNP
jgi:hypothetical protein